MNPRWEIYRTGAAMVIRTVYLKGGRRVVVIDRAKMARSAARMLAASGHSPRQISRLIKRKLV